MSKKWKNKKYNVSVSVLGHWRSISYSSSSSRSRLRLHAVVVVSTPFVYSVDNEFVLRIAVSTKTECSAVHKMHWMKIKINSNLECFSVFRKQWSLSGDRLQACGDYQQLK